MILGAEDDVSGLFSQGATSFQMRNGGETASLHGGLEGVG